MRKTVISFGEILWDILPDRTLLGGAPFNLAFRVNSLGDRGLIVSRLGSDELGRRAFDQVVALGLDTSYLQTDEDHPTGTVRVTFDTNNNPDFVIIPEVAYDYIEVTSNLLEAASAADYFCFGTLSQRSTPTRRSLEELLDAAENSIKLLDINLRKDCYTAETVRWSLGHCDILKLNEDEARELSLMLFGRFHSIDRFSEKVVEKYSLRYCVVTLAEKGAFACSRQNEKVYIPGYRIELADSVGAGDAFTAGFVHCLLKKLSLSEAVEFGNILGALVSTQTGATAPVTNPEIERFRSRGSERIYDSNFECFI